VFFVHRITTTIDLAYHNYDLSQALLHDLPHDLPHDLTTDETIPVLQRTG